MYDLSCLNFERQSPGDMNSIFPSRMAALHLRQVLSLSESREGKKKSHRKLCMDLKEPCALYIFFAASRRGIKGQGRVCVWGFGALLLLPVLGGLITVTCKHKSAQPSRSTEYSHACFKQISLLIYKILKNISGYLRYFSGRKS